VARWCVGDRRHERRGPADPTWTYWLARAQLARQARSDADRAAARAQLLEKQPARPARAASTNKLALEELGQPITVPPAPPPLTRRGKARPRAATPA
jgi:soluble lytic murein transglycosylase